MNISDIECIDGFVHINIPRGCVNIVSSTPHNAYKTQVLYVVTINVAAGDQDAGGEVTTIQDVQKGMIGVVDVPVLFIVKVGRDSVLYTVSLLFKV